jgi:dTDP-glucose 4,6-dehydratase
VGESYNLGSGEEAANLDLVRLIVAHLEARLGRRLAHLITFVPDRAGHDWRYALESAKARRELGFRCRHRLGEGLRATVDWYLDHLGWVATVSGQAPPEETPEIGWRAQKEEAHRLAAAQRPG